MSITSHRYERMHNGRTYIVNYYGVVWDTEVVEYVMTSIGVIELKLYRKFIGNELLICADMWQGADGIGVSSTFTKFRAVVHIRNGQIIENIRGYNEFWVELEGVIQRAIAVNE